MEKKVTKIQRYMDIINLLEGKSIVYGTDITTAISFIENEIVLINKKNANKSKKDIAAQEVNEEYRVLITDYLTSASEGVTCTEIARAIPEFNDFSNQKIAALLRPLIYDEEKNPEGVVIKTLKKGKSLFTMG